MRRFISLFGIPVLVTALLLASRSPAAAATWAEIGDAGQLPATAQITSGAGGLDTITGAIGAAFDADMYRIVVTGAVPFSAVAIDSWGDGQLFLFDSTGMGVLANDVDPGGDPFKSTIPATMLAAGIYYLAISDFDTDPVSSLGEIFPDSPDNAVHGPTGPGGGLPVSAWTMVGSQTGTYTITLAGADFATAVPEPASLLLLGGGLTGLATAAWRRNRRN